MEALDAAVYPAAPRPIAHAFTTENGVSFQLLASASTTKTPVGRVTVVSIRPT